MDPSELEEKDASFTVDDRLRRELGHLAALCPGLKGATIATTEGLALCATDGLSDEKASAAATFMLAEIDALLGMLHQARTREVLVWTDDGPWYLTRMRSQPYVLALQAMPEVAAAALRHAGALGAERLAAILSQLEAA